MKAISFFLLYKVKKFNLIVETSINVFCITAKHRKLPQSILLHLRYLNSN